MLNDSQAQGLVSGTNDPLEMGMKEQIVSAVFPGQGSQRPGMGKDFYDNLDISKQTYEEASDALGWDVAPLCFGDDERLNLTEYAQPCIVATEIAMLRGIREIYGVEPQYFGGHSLGEYTGLVAAGVIPFPEAIRAVHIRGRLMQEASPPGMGGMTAVIGESLDIDAIASALENLPIDIANINSANQVVLSGAADSMETACKRITVVFGGKGTDHSGSLRFVPLQVSAPFHSRFMNTIKDVFREKLTAFSASIKPETANRVTSNCSGTFHSRNTDDIIENLVAQISSAVNWRDNMQVLAETSGRIFEIGPSRPLKGFFASIGISCQSITTFSSARRALDKKE